jgi:predicted GNAT family N-acyltransferase
MPNTRNTFVDGDWVLRKVEPQSLCDSFDCGDDDLNEYFHVDAIHHRRELLGQSYYLHEQSSPYLVVALIDFCNDTVHLAAYKRALEKYSDLIPIVEQKRYLYLPAVKITRFGIQKEFQGNNLGSHVLNMVKKFFTTDNRTGCRFVTVDSYTNVVGFYEKNGFGLLTEKDKNKDSRAMFFDLKRLQT